MRTNENSPHEKPIDREKAISAVRTLLNKFETCDIRTLAALKEEAMSLSAIIEKLNPRSDIQSLEAAGDLLVVLIGNIDLIQKGYISLEDAKSNVRTDLLKY